MLYAGHFSFVGPRREALAEPRARGRFLLMAEAASIEEAGEKFRHLVERAKGTYASFEDVEVVWVDDVIGVRRLPEEGVLALFGVRLDPDEGYFTETLPGVPAEFCVSYAWRAPGQPPASEDDDEGEDEPFVNFGEG